MAKLSKKQATRIKTRRCKLRDNAARLLFHACYLFSRRMALAGYRPNARQAKAEIKRLLKADA